MPEIKKYPLVQRLKDADERFNKDPAVVGMSSLTAPGYINSTRTQMFTAHMSQFLNICKPQFPKVFTGAENTVGEYSSAHKEVENDSVVYRKLYKYDDIVDKPYIGFLFLFDKVEEKFSVVERKENQADLIEDFTFCYNNEGIDNVEEGDELKAGHSLYKSLSYDEDDNYRYGRNATVAYELDPWTAEDAAKISEDFAIDMSVHKSKTFEIGYNTNEVGLNLYGDEDNYKVLPDIGEECGSILAAVRPLRKKDVRYELAAENLSVIHYGVDRAYYGLGKGSVVVDFDIFCNADELEKNSFNKQILKYMKSQDKFWKKVRETCKEIKKSGYKYTKDINYLLKRSKEYFDYKKKWQNKNGDRFGGIKVRVTVLKLVPMDVGDKFTGRCGNKSVVSKVVPNDEMPFTDTGKRVDVVLNLLAIINRTTAFVLLEMFINFATNRAIEQMEKMESFKDRAEFMFDFLEDINKRQSQMMRAYFNTLPEKEKEQYIISAMENGINVEQVPIWEDEYLFFKLYRLHKKYEWLKPYHMFQKKWGQVFPTLTDMYIGEMYMIRLKQTPERGFSGRSMGSVSLKLIPERSYKNRNGTEWASDTAIRQGEYEFLTLGTGMSSEEQMIFHALYRTSIKGRKDLMRSIHSGNDISLIGDVYDSQVAKLFSVIFKSLSLEIEFQDEDTQIRPLDTRQISAKVYKGKTYFMNEHDFYLMTVEDKVRDAIITNNPLISGEELEEMIDEEMEHVNAIMAKRPKKKK